MTKKPNTLGELNTTAGKINTRVGQVCTKVDKLSAKVGELSIKADELQHAIMRRDREIAAIGELLLRQDQKLTDLMARIAEKLALEEPRHRPLTWREREKKRRRSHTRKVVEEVLRKARARTFGGGRREAGRQADLEKADKGVA